MNPDKEIVTWWLNRNGFFTINSIKASNNREVDILAIRLSEGSAEEIQHVELACSITKSESYSVQEYLKKFNDKAIDKVVKDAIKAFVGREATYRKVLVVGELPLQSELRKLSEITVLRFSDIATQVIKRLDKQNHRNPTIRSIQMIKYLVLANPKKSAEILLDEEYNKTLNQITKDIFVRNILSDAEVQRLIGKEENERALIEILKHSTLNKPEKLAKLIDEEVLGKRSRNKFINAFLKSEEVKKEIKTELARDQKTLKLFLE
ncbi:hypothetical protein JXA85_02145 [Candidatus Woesearchaeota archaeon]|nr:hypothetical protein [Candidatus Woesearchaeota archaeon]